MTRVVESSNTVTEFNNHFSAITKLVPEGSGHLFIFLKEKDFIWCYYNPILEFKESFSNVFWFTNIGSTHAMTPWCITIFSIIELLNHPIWE
jgi:hypothetical protein